MSAEVIREKPDFFVVHIEGIFTYEDQKKIQQTRFDDAAPREKVKVLILAETFSGWGKEGDWGDLTFMYQSDPYVDKIAVVTHARWRDEIMMFLGAGRRKALVQYYPPGQKDMARIWLNEIR